MHQPHLQPSQVLMHKKSILCELSTLPICAYSCGTCLLSGYWTLCVYTFSFQEFRNLIMVTLIFPHCLSQCLVCGDPRTKEQIKPRRVLECRNGKTRPISSFSPHVITINRFQVLLSSVTCLLSYPTGRRYLPYSSPTQYTFLMQSAKDPQDPYPTPCTVSKKVD